MAMFAAGGGGIDDASEANVEVDAVDAALGFLLLDWLKRRMNELLRVGRVSGGAPVKDGMVEAAAAGTLVLKVPGAGKSLRSGS